MAASARPPSAFDAGLGVIRRGDSYASTSNAVVLPAYTRLDAALFYAINTNYKVQLAAFVAARETVEIALFLRAGVPGAGAGSISVGVVMGAISAIGLSALFRVSSRRLNLMLMFQ